MSLWLRCNRGVRGVGVGRRPCPYGDELQPRYSNSEEIAVWFSSWGSSPNMETWTLSLGAPETRRGFFLKRAADAQFSSRRLRPMSFLMERLWFVGAVFNQTSGEHQVNQPSTQSMADDTKVQ
jgi:hypothetical protein